MTAMLSLSGICSFHGTVQALRDVDLEVAAGEKGVEQGEIGIGR